MASRYTKGGTESKGVEEANRRLLGVLHRNTTGPFSVAEAAALLCVARARARRLVAYLAARGWLSRVRHGLYIVVPLEASQPSKWREDPWIVAEKTFSPCYIGGWSACEHWEFTEQVFRDVVVVTTRPVRSKQTEIQGTGFRLRHVPQRQLFGTRVVWRKEVRVQVSDPSRTVIDVLDDPSLGGGIRHASDVLTAYFESAHRDDELLVEYGLRAGNRTVFKRLGYLVEKLAVGSSEGLLGRCRELQSAGLSALDPAVKARGRIVKRWNLRVNVTLLDREEENGGDQPS